jgi:hypothetical protein
MEINITLTISRPTSGQNSMRPLTYAGPLTYMTIALALLQWIGP